MRRALLPLPPLVLLHLFADLLNDVGPALLEGRTVGAGDRAATLDLLFGTLVELGLAGVLGLGDAALVSGSIFLGLLLTALGVFLLFGVVGSQEVVEGVAGLLGLLCDRRGGGSAQLLFQLRDLLVQRRLLLLEVGFDPRQLDQTVGLLLGGSFVRQGFALRGNLGQVGIRLDEFRLPGIEPGPNLGALGLPGIGGIGGLVLRLGRAEEAAAGRAAQERQEREIFHDRLQGDSL